MDAREKRRQAAREKAAEQLAEIARMEGVPLDFFSGLLNLEREYAGYRRRRYFFTKLVQLFEDQIGPEEPK